MFRRSQPREPDRHTDPASVAAGWFAKARSGEMDAADRAARLDYLDDPRNEDDYKELEKLWSDLEDLRGDPRVQRMRQESANEVKAIRRRKTIGVFAIAASLLLVVGPHSLPHMPVAQVAMLKFESPVGERRRLTLEDGSVVQMDANSALRVAYSATERRILLDRGRALFTVASNRAWPFVVIAQENAVTALGTSFSVSRAESGLDVVLLRGRVQVGASDRSHSVPAVTMEPGTALAVRGDRRILRSIDANAAQAWTEGKLVFDDVPLAEAIQEIERYTLRSITIADPRVGRERISAVLRAGDVQSFVTAVRQSELASIATDGSGNIVLAPLGQGRTN